MKITKNTRHMRPLGSSPKRRYYHGNVSYASLIQNSPILHRELFATPLSKVPQRNPTTKAQRTTHLLNPSPLHSQWPKVPSKKPQSPARPKSTFPSSPLPSTQVHFSNSTAPTEPPARNAARASSSRKKHPSYRRTRSRRSRARV